MPLFRSKTKSPQELVHILKEALMMLSKQKGEKESKKAMEDLCKTLQAIKTKLYGPGNQEPQSELVAQLAAEMCQQNLLLLLVQNIQRVEFERRKDVVVIFNNLLRRQMGVPNPTVEHICMKPDLLMELIKGYENQDIALNCGMMLRECCRAQELVRIIMNSQEFYKFFTYVDLSAFDIATDAFSTFKELITKHKVLSAEFLDKNYDTFFSHYRKLLSSQNYVTRRQALKLLGDLLLDRHNFTVMTRYISRSDNLKQMMIMLKDKSRNIQFEAFHVFKVFVANPSKPQPIQDILLRNKDKLVDFLTKFHTDRSEDEQFSDEKAYLIKQIKDMKTAPATLTAREDEQFSDEKACLIKQRT